MNRLWALTVTPTRVGSWARPGAIDLPLTRRRHTRIPYVPGSSLKGALRAHVESRLDAPNDPSDDVLKELGEDPEERKERAVRTLFG
ncbi:RAMP superfamily CRISPR-associated protein, partial [Methanopyrus sp.]